MEHALKRATAEKTREQTKEWKANRKALRVEVADSIKQRPDVAADLFFGSGELYGKKVPLGSVKMDASKLTDVQKAALPRGYYGEHGFAPDDVAGMFGYGSGDSMVEALANYNVAKTAAGKMSAKDFVSRVTDTETDRQMAAKYGNLENNIIDSAKLQATNEVQQDALHMEVEKFAAEHGVTFGNKAEVRQQLLDQFAKMPIGSVKSDQYLRAAGKAGRLIESGLLHGKPQEAFAAKLQQYYATVLAHEAAKLEAKELPKFDKLTKKFTKAFDPTKSTGIDAEYSLFIRDILSRVGRKYGMSVQGLEQGIAKSGYTDLGDFVAKTNALYGMSGVELPVADFLKDPTFRKDFKQLTVEEFRGLNDSVTALNTFGRNVDKVTREGEKVERKDWVQKAGEQLSNKFKPQDLGATGKPGVVRTYFASLMNMETLFGRFDGRDAEGLFTKMFVYPGARAANAKDTLMREYSKGLKEAGVIKDADKKLVSPLIDPRTKKPVTDFTRENLATIISNMGNDYNWKVLTKGWDIDPDVLWKWVEANSTVEDVQRAQKIGELFNRAKGESDNVYRNMYGVAPQDIQVRPFTMHGVNFDGWYHPIIYDPIRSKLSKLTTGDPSKNEFENFWPSVANPYTKKRTGNVDVISLSQSMVPIKLNQMLHDIAFREFVHESAKVVRDDGFRNHVSTYYGPEYVDTIDTWLSRVAGNASFNDNAMAMATRLSNQIRGNVVSTYIAFSPTTIQKHGLTAAVMSAKEVGTKKFSRVLAEVAADSLYHATMDLFGKGQGLGDTLWQFVRKNSEEIQRRDRNFEQTLGGQMDLTLGKSTLRQRIIELGSKGVAFSDMVSAVPTWLAKYREAMDESADIGRATDLADRAVRRAHGSTAITNQPTIVSHTNPLSPWLTTIYGFFGTNMQRRFEIAHDINDAFKLGKSGDIAGAAKAAPTCYGQHHDLCDLAGAG
jgi:hypothetical protein